MKAYTDLEQSKKLAEILPIESADMCYPKDAFAFNYDEEPVCHYSGIGLAHPCWSLTALLEIIPGGQVNKMADCNKYEASSWNDSDFEPQMYVENFDNPVDACYEMIIKLNELKLL